MGIMRDDFLYKGKYKPREFEVIFKCDNCEEEIYEGNYYYDINGEKYCEDCIDDCRKTAVPIVY